MVTLALVGAGAWGRNYLATAKRIAGAQIKHIVAAHAKSAAPYASEYRVSTDIAELPRDIGGVILATPAKTHYALAKQLLARGYNLLIEKPLTTSAAEARELANLWRKGRSKVLVGHLWLYNPAYRCLKSELRTLGRLRKISFKGAVSPPRKDVSVLWDWGPHPASLLLDLIHEPIAKISASDSPEHVQFSIRYESSLTAEIDIAWTGDEKKRELAIEGENGTITLDDTKKKQKVRLERRNTAISFPEYDARSPLEVELEEFVRAIKGEGQITSDMETGVRVTELLANIEQQL
ncbi:hypothetical protein A3A39_03040 [Candidatus Kaiserbacteria bacterium RIFCSPLOWO2_01_FULL_54_13]|uniref:Gfo/Idh/MocA-like oxidoreductase N-terminal domain-containing protein n=1 Tax=Candidatus Kaiserbacteria bacterium RIFCSPLOWO2_01_FULL_54_13 TaxID=1798512 RepID=A0A1F6F2H8_9BACT|nr:MAG: hypothetical protein A3A39_03040 [Candidatus Kaiserbacteria bacterium RIFCSPLOWO2_01_FULL_54_13]